MSGKQQNHYLYIIPIATNIEYILAVDLSFFFTLFCISKHFSLI